MGLKCLRNQKPSFYFYFLLISSMLILTIVSFPQKSRAIPPFAEKYHFACAVCHTVFPNLNPFGRAFWRNGLRLPNTNGTPADATEITQGLSLPNPWPVPLSVATWVQYTHITNENTIPNIGTLPMVMLMQNNTDNFSASSMIDSGGSFKLYNPFFNSISYFVMNNIGSTTGSNVPLTNAQTWASLNGLGYGFGVPPHLINLKMGMPDTAAPYFYRQMPMFIQSYSNMRAQGLDVGFDAEAGKLINAANPGIAVYGTPGYNLWYKIVFSNDQGSSGTTSNAFEYSYQLKEYLQLKNGGQLEFGYYGAHISEPVSGSPNWVIQDSGSSTQSSPTTWINPILVNGFDIDYSFPGYMSEIGITYMHQTDFHPYGNPSLPAQNFCLPSENTSVVNGFPGDNAGGACPSGYSSHGSTNSSNGYSAIDIYGMASFMQNMHEGLMLMAEFSFYRWDNKKLQEAYNFDYNSKNTTTYLYINNNLMNPQANIFQDGAYQKTSGGLNSGVGETLQLSATYNIAYNSYLYAVYTLAINKPEDNVFGTGLAFAF